METITPQKPKRYLITIIVIIIILAAILGACYYFLGSLKKDEHIQKLIPHVNMGSINITEINGEHIKFTAHIGLANPFPVNFVTRRIQYQVYVDTAMIAESSYEQPINVASLDSTTLDIPMEASLKRLVGILKEFKKQHIDSTDYKIIAQIYMDVPIAGERQFDFNIVKHLPAFITPEIKLADTDIKKLGFKESGIDMDFNIHNNNLFDMKIKNGHFSVTLDKNIDLEGTLEELHIPSKGMQTVSVHFDIKTGKLGKAAWKILFDKKDTHFNFVFKGIANADNDIFHNTNLMITAHGTLSEALKAAKELK